MLAFFKTDKLACIILSDICKFPSIFLLFYGTKIQQFMEKALRVSQFFWGQSREKSGNDGKLGETKEELLFSGIVKADTRLGIQSAAFHLQHCALSETLVGNACSGLQVAGKGRSRTLQTCGVGCPERTQYAWRGLLSHLLRSLNTLRLCERIAHTYA